MVANNIALILTAVVSILVPVVILGIVWMKHSMERKGITLAFCIGIISYVTMQWGLKSHVLLLLLKNTGLGQWSEHNYLLYHFLIAVVGSCLTILPCYLLVKVFFKGQVSFAKATMWGLGYAMAESTMLVGVRCITTVVYFIQNQVEDTTVATGELYLSVYERILFLVINTAVFVGLIYLIQQKMEGRGLIITMIICVIIQFVPDFLMAFSTVEFAETIDRSVSLLLTSVVLTMTAITGIMVISALKYSLKDSAIDSKQAVLAYQRKAEEKSRKKAAKKEEKKKK